MVKVSVVIPCYNAQNTITRALKSVIEQSYKDYEVIMVDDGSTDESRSIIENFIKKYSSICIKIVCQNNGGPSKARNTGIAIARGEYIAFLDADDSWYKDKLKYQMEFMENNSDVFILGSATNIVIDGKISNESKYDRKFKEVSFYRRLIKTYFFTSSVIIRKESIKYTGMFDTSQKYAEDSLLFLKILRKFKGGYLDLPLVNYYKRPFGDSGLTSNLFAVEKYELRNYFRLLKENKSSKRKISILFYLFINAFSIAKFIRRIIITTFAKMIRL